MGPQWVKDYMLSLFTLTVYITWMTGTIPLCTSTNLLYPKRSMSCNSSWLYSGQISPPGLQSSNVCHVYFYWICNKQFLNLESWFVFGISCLRVLCSCVLAGRMEIIYDKENNFSLTTGACLIRGFEIDISWRYTCVIVSTSINVIHTD